MKRLITALVTKQIHRAGSPFSSLHLKISRKGSNVTAKAYFSAATAPLNSLLLPSTQLQSQQPTDTEIMSEAVYNSKTLKESNAKTFQSLGSKLQKPLLDALNDMGYE
jgi:hypothetical protein